MPEPAHAADPVRSAVQGCDSYVHAAEASRVGGPPLPTGFAGNATAGALGSTYSNGFAWSTALERLLFHEATWPIILELTGGEPWMQGAVTLYDDFSRGNASRRRDCHLMAPPCTFSRCFNSDKQAVSSKWQSRQWLGNAHAMGGFLHCKRDAQKRNPDMITSAPDGYTEPVYCRARDDGTVESDNFVIFPYFDDVGPDDGGIFLLPGSHKSPLARPETLFGSIGQTGSKVAGRNFGGNSVIAHDAAWDDSPEARDLIPGTRPVDMQIPEGCIKPEFKAGDILILPEATLHCVVPWRAEDGRTRRALMLRHDFQHRAPDSIHSTGLEGLVHPLTAELVRGPTTWTIARHDGPDHLGL